MSREPEWKKRGRKSKPKKGGQSKGTLDASQMREKVKLDAEERKKQAAGRISNAGEGDWMLLQKKVGTGRISNAVEGDWMQTGKVGKKAKKKVALDTSQMWMKVLGPWEGRFAFSLPPLFGSLVLC